MEIGLMNMMGIDASTIGNHEFDFGIDNMARMFKMANFPILCSNYDFTGTVLQDVVKPYTIIKRKGIKIGVFALNPQMEGLVLEKNCVGIKFLDPAKVANEMASMLKKEKKCDVVICISHLGWTNDLYSDLNVFSKTRGYVDGTAIADITISSSYAGAESNGFYNIEYPIPDKLIVDKNGNAKKQFVVKLQASSSTFCPGLYFLRLMKEYDDHAYRFVANDWVTGDAARVSANNITYDTEKNIIHVRRRIDSCLDAQSSYRHLHQAELGQIVSTLRMRSGWYRK